MTSTLCDNCKSEIPENSYYCNNCEYEGQYVPCPDCDGEMSWCSCCQVYTQDCCISWGTCQCS